MALTIPLRRVVESSPIAVKLENHFSLIVFDETSTNLSCSIQDMVWESNLLNTMK